MLTVRDLTEGTGVRVLAGARGLDRAVRWVHISELADPTPWLSGGELLLTTGMVLDADGDGYLGRLAEHGLAGVGIGIGVGGVDVVPDALVREADARGFPLIEVPYETPFIALTEKAFTLIVNEQAATLARASAAHERLQRIVLSEGGLDGVVAALAGLIGGAAVVSDAHGEVLARRGDPAGEDAVRLPVLRPGVEAPQAWLEASRTGAPLSELDRLIVQQAVTVVGLELLRRRVAAETEHRLAGDVVSSLLSGELAGPELERRLRPFGLGERIGVVVVDGPHAVEALAAAVRATGAGGLVAGAGPLACALLPARGSEADLRAQAEAARAAAARTLGEPLAAGVSRPTAAADGRRAFHEARCALEATAMRNGDRPALSTFDDLGSFQLLLSVQDDDALRLFCESILAPVEEGDAAYGGELRRSLEVFIECNGQWERAARRLSCHRHTLRYRVRRIEELTGRSLDTARDRIDFWLALRGRELLG